MDVLVKFGDYRLNSGRIILLFAGRTRFTHLYAVFTAFCSRLAASSDVTSSKFGRPILPGISV